MIALLCGGVGGSKLALGLYRVLGPDTLRVVVNTADDLEMFGLHVSPDLDTVTYTLAGIVNEDTGWGLADDTFIALDALGRLGEPTWFHIGDRDLATHVWRTHRLNRGDSLSAVAQEMADRFGIRARILPMCDEPVATSVQTADGWLPFQEYFVLRRHQDRPVAVRHDGVSTATLAPIVRSTLEAADAIIIAPSNPVVSIGPILAVPGMGEMLAGAPGVRIAVSPIVRGRAVSGPADRLMAALGYDVSPLGVAQMYRGMIDTLVIDRADEGLRTQVETLGVQVHVTDTLMHDVVSKERLAGELLHLAESTASAPRTRDRS